MAKARVRLSISFRQVSKAESTIQNNVITISLYVVSPNKIKRFINMLCTNFVDKLTV